MGTLHLCVEAYCRHRMWTVSNLVSGIILKGSRIYTSTTSLFFVHSLSFPHTLTPTITVQEIRPKSLCATVSHASGEQGAHMGSPRSFHAKTLGWPAMPRPTLDSRRAGIPSPSTSVPIVGRPCTGRPAVNPKWWRSPWAPSPIRRFRHLLKQYMPNTGIDGFRTCQQVRRLSSRLRFR